MILSDSQLLELRRRLKLTTVPNWKTIPGLENQILTLKALLYDSFVRKQNEAYFIIQFIRNRVLLLGPGGCCKHLLIDYCLHSLFVENDGNTPSINSFWLFDIDVFAPGEYIRINIDGDYIENDNDAFRIISRHLSSPSMHRFFLFLFIIFR